MQAFGRVLGTTVALALLGCGADDPASQGSGGSPAVMSGGAGSSAASGGAAGTGPGTAAGGSAGGSSSGAPGSGGTGGVPVGGGGGGGAAGGSGGGATCLPGDELPAPTPVDVNEQGAPFSGAHEVVVETDPGLPGYTVYRPQDLGGGAKYPIVTWGQGGCSLNGTTDPDFLGEIASHGYLVIADGEPNGSGSRPQGSDYKTMGLPLLAPIDWAIEENDRACSQYYQSLEVSKVAVMGFSCGGLMAEGASSDPRLTTVMLWSTGMLEPDPQVIEDMHAPTAIILGGPGDIAYENGTRDYEDIDHIPVLLASTDVGHGGTYAQDNGGAFGEVAVAWLGWWLQGDLGATGKGMFVGPSCGLCSDSDWTVESKNLE